MAEKKPLSQKQKLAARLLAEAEQQPDLELIANRVGVLPSTLMKWMKNKEFTEAVGSLSRKPIPHDPFGVWEALVEKCKNGDIQAMKLYFELAAKELSSDGTQEIVVTMSKEAEEYAK